LSGRENRDRLATLALELAKREIEATSTKVVRVDQLEVDRMRHKLLTPLIRYSNAQLSGPPKAVYLHPLGNEFLADCDARIGVIFLRRDAVSRGDRAGKVL
jgi:hypothetical protein